MRPLLPAVFGAWLATWLVAVPASAFVIQIADASFSVTNTFSTVSDFSFSIDVASALVPGSYVDPVLHSVQYQVSGTLAPGTPSGFSGFNLQRSIAGSEFYAQGSSLSFVIPSGADLSDGLQLSELTGADPVFVFNGREEGNGRFHPALLELYGDGTGRLQNSDNIVSFDPFNQVGFGQEYVTDLMFDPGTLTLAVPEPRAAVLVLAALAALTPSRRRE